MDEWINCSISIFHNKKEWIIDTLKTIMLSERDQAKKNTE